MLFRSYGIGQYTLYHHPPRAEELEAFILDPAGNVRQSARELQEKLTGFVVGNSSGTRADDRIAEAGLRPLRLCRYGATDPRYLRDCAQCARSAGRTDLRQGDPVYAGANLVFQRTAFYGDAAHEGVPVRGEIPCDWPYAVRRYNGAGVNSYHYQAIVLRNLLDPVASD